MAGTPGNKNAVGNKGGRSYDKENRRKADTLKGLVLDEAIKIMQMEYERDDPIFNKVITQKKDMVMSKILPNTMPRQLEGTGDDQRPIPILLKMK